MRVIWALILFGLGAVLRFFRKVAGHVVGWLYYILVKRLMRRG